MGYVADRLPTRALGLTGFPPSPWESSDHDQTNLASSRGHASAQCAADASNLMASTACTGQDRTGQAATPGARGVLAWEPPGATSAERAALDCSMMMMNTAWLRLLASLSLVAPVMRASLPLAISVYTCTITPVIELVMLTHEQVAGAALSPQLTLFDATLLLRHLEAMYSAVGVDNAHLTFMQCKQ